MKYRCFKCNKVGTYSLEKNYIKIDEVDEIMIFKCKFCGVRFKPDRFDYETRGGRGKNIALKTFSARTKRIKKPMTSQHTDQRGFIDKWWWAILIAVMVFAFADDVIQGRIF